MKYKCLCLDHDDTVVASTATIHYPCFVDYLRAFRPTIADRYSLSLYFERNFDPGISAFLSDEIGLTPEEVKHEEAFWDEYVRGRIPPAFDGMRRLLADFRAAGGIIAVISHSMSHNIERDYRENDLPLPDEIYGWDMPPIRRKPSPYALLELMRKYGLHPDRMLVVDDLKPGYDMARAAGVPFAAAGWAYDVPRIAEFMQKNSDHYLASVQDLYDLVFGA